VIVVGKYSAVLVALALGAAALPPNASVDQIVDRIRRDGGVTSEFVGFAGTPSPGYAAFKKLKEVASEADLRRLVGDRSPAVRVYAFYALADRRPDQVPFDVLLSRMGDLAPVETMQGCVLDHSVVRDLMLDWIDARLSISQRTALLERLLADKKLTPAGEHALRTWRVEPRLYEALGRQWRVGRAPHPGALSPRRRSARHPTEPRRRALRCARGRRGVPVASLSADTARDPDRFAEEEGVVAGRDARHRDASERAAV
jgi:hypothetical protein